MFVKYGNLVVTIRSVTMICPAAKLEIAEMGSDNADHGRNEEPNLPVVPGLFGEQKRNAKAEQQEWS